MKFFPVLIRIFLSLSIAGLVSCAAPPRSAEPQPPATVVTPPAPKPIRIGLALGGGAARGFAHIGVIKTLEAQGIPIDLIVGTSAGSVVGSLYASGLSGFELQQVALRMDESVFADWTLGNRGMFRGEALQQWVNQQIGARAIEQLPRRLGITATDLNSGELVVFQRGNVGMAVRASSAVPGVFTPVNIQGREYVDGGLSAPVPVQTARRLGADVVIAVDISAEPSAQSTSNVTELLLQTFAIMGRSINRYELAEADVVMKPVLATKSIDFAARHLAILAGEQAAMAALPRLRQKLAEKGQR